MKRLIPGKVRFEGVELYDAGMVTLLEKSESGLSFSVENYHVFYLPPSDISSCDCSFFPDNGYCEHLAAVQTFVNYEMKDVLLDTSAHISSESSSLLLSQQRFQESSLFLKKFPFSFDTVADDALRLSVFGEWDDFAQDFAWTLKISKASSHRSYVIRDIPSFLSLVETGASYQLGASDLVNLYFSSFDISSQKLLSALKSFLSQKSPQYFSSNRYLYLPGFAMGEMLSLFKALDDSQLVLKGRIFEHFTLSPLVASEGLFYVKVTPELEGLNLSFRTVDYLSLADGSLIFWQGNFYSLSLDQSIFLKQFLSLPLTADGNRQLNFSWENQDNLIELLDELKKFAVVDVPESFRVHDFTPHFTFYLDGKGMLCLNTVYSGENFSVADQADLEALPVTLTIKKRRQIQELLAIFGFNSVFTGRRPRLSEDELYYFFSDLVPQLQALGRVNLSPDLQNFWLYASPTVHFDLTGQLLEVDFDTEHISQGDLNQALASLAASRPYHRLDSGQLLAFSPEFLSLLDQLKALGAQKSQSGAYVLPALAAFRLNASLSSYPHRKFSEELKQLHRHLAHPETFEMSDFHLSASLRDYQLKGVQWLSVLDHYGFGGILADDMGLGKTLQAIAFLSSRLQEGQKALILAPASLVYNWQEEFAKFYPQAQVTLVYGQKAERLSRLEAESQIFISSYQSFRQDILAYQVKDFDYLILDEAQVLKNHQTKLAKLLSNFTAKRVFALSGTPIENRLMEVWSLFEIVLPGLFPNKSAFATLSPQEVAQTIQPFVLRRTKEEVLEELPLITEVVYQNDLSSTQKSLYLAQIKELTEQVASLTASAFSKQGLAVLAGLTRLRQICDSPALFMPYEGESGKLDSLKILLQQLKSNGHRVLIFSQFRGMLDMIEELVANLEMTSFKITGSTPSQERQTITKVFNKGARDVVLISLKAGGVGLNLTGADVVILVDLWWNPAVDLQAIGRAHRLGQTKQVTVYRLVTHGTIEEKILQLQEQKRDLISQVLRSDDTRQQLSLDDIRQILGISG